ncbi:MAG: hypothetical protein Q9N62_14480 [Ghiorsea sp.]|nr:hypothetical protein [Ghiorsea sp.]
MNTAVYPAVYTHAGLQASLFNWHIQQTLITNKVTTCSLNTLYGIDILIEPQQRTEHLQ